EFIGELVHFNAAKQFLDGFRAHLGDKLTGILGGELAVFLFLKDLTLLEDSDFALVDNDEGFEVENALEVAHGNVQQVANTARESLEEPHVRAGGREFNVSEAFAAYFAESDFDTALVADDSAVLHALVLSAQALPVGDGTEDFGAEQTVTFRLEGAVIDGFRLGDFAMGPRADFLRAGQADTDRIEIRDQTGTIIGAAAIQGRFLPPAPCGAGRGPMLPDRLRPNYEYFYSRRECQVAAPGQARRYGWILLSRPPSLRAASGAS